MPGGSRYPGGRGPTTGGPIGRGSSRESRNRKDAVIPITTLGMLRTVSGNQFVVEADDHRIITYRIADDMKAQQDGADVELSSFAAGDHLTVDSTADENGFFTAVAVTFNSAGNSADKAAAARTWDLPDLLPQAKAAKQQREPGDDRPILRRKGGAPSEESEAQEKPNAPEVAANTPAPTAPEPPTEPERPATVMRPSDPPPDADDPGRPALRRGRPAPRVSSSPAPNSVDLEPSPGPIAVAATPIVHDGPQTEAPPAGSPADPVIPIQEDPELRKARDAMATYGASLPNFFAKQAITRYESEGKSGWQALDIITADVAYEDGKESYGNITQGGKQKKSMEETGGTWSTGQFQGLLDDLFDAGTAASFRKTGQETLRGRSTFVFKFDVRRENSRWRINAPSQLYYPAYRGTIWIDKQSSRVLRLEMEARGVPLLFPFDKVESATDYDLIRLSSPQQFLLPVSAEVLGCETGTTRCTRNRIEYRNYRKFGAESDITFDDK